MRNFSNNASFVPASRIGHGGFTLVEVLVAILIFGLGLISAFVLSNAASSLSMRSKQEIIATNLLREQIELFKNIRDTNFLALRDFNSLRGADPTCSGLGCEIETGYAVLGTSYSPSGSPVFYKKGIFPGASPNPSGNRAHQALVSAESLKPIGTTTVRYCQDGMGRYHLDCDSSMKFTPYYGFVLVQPLETDGAGVPKFVVEGAFQITAYFATTEGGYRELAISTIVTDFKK
jgi:prepilin-type N-terminal cleavage/methylation domain-containing protein